MKLLPPYRTTGWLLAAFYAVGIVGLSLNVTRDFFTILIPWVLLMNAALLIIYHGNVSKREVVVFTLIGITGFILEMVGVNTGLIFGSYQYGSIMGIGIANTPLLIGVNWFMLIYCTYLIASRLTRQPFLRILLGALLMVGYDLVLEPSAIHFGMWTWESGIIPLSNYITWFVISLILLSFLHFSRVRLRNQLAIYVYWVQFVFFLILWILYRIG